MEALRFLQESGAARSSVPPLTFETLIAWRSRVRNIVRNTVSEGFACAAFRAKKLRERDGPASTGPSLALPPLITS
jgi:hypothetical protein